MTDGVLGTFTISSSRENLSPQAGGNHQDNVSFSDVKEVLFYEDDPRFYKVGTVNSYVQFPVSAGDRFAWIDREPTPGETAAFRYLGKVYEWSDEQAGDHRCGGGRYYRYRPHLRPHCLE